MFWHHEGAAKGLKPIGYGNCRVVAGPIVDLPFFSRPVCLPVLARLWARRGAGKIAYARRWWSGSPRAAPAAPCTWSATPSISASTPRELGEDITWTSRLKIISALHQPPPPRTGQVRRPLTKGPRLGTPGCLAAAATSHKSTVRRYGRTDTVEITETVYIWYGILHTQTGRVILERDDKPGTKDKDERGYGLALITIDLISDGESLIARYASRWGIEPVFFNARRVLGVGEACNRQRTVPLGLITCSFVILLYTGHGHDPQQIADVRARRRWYTTKAERSFEDVVTKLRRVIIAARFQHPAPTSQNPKKPAPSSWPGPQPKHDHLEVRKSRARIAIQVPVPARAPPPERKVVEPTTTKATLSARFSAKARRRETQGRSWSRFGSGQLDGMAQQSVAHGDVEQLVSVRAASEGPRPSGGWLGRGRQALSDAERARGAVEQFIDWARCGVDAGVALRVHAVVRRGRRRVRGPGPGWGRTGRAGSSP